MANISSVIEKALARNGKQAVGDTIKDTLIGSLESRLFSSLDMSRPFRLVKMDFLRNYLQDLLILCFGNVSLAAKKAGLNRRHLHRILQGTGVDADWTRKELLKPEHYLRSSIHDILENCLTSAVAGRQDDLEDISDKLSKELGALPYDEAVATFERGYFENALRQNKYSIEKTAEYSDMSERSVYRKIRKLNLAVA